MKIICNNKEFEIGQGESIGEVLKEEIKNASREIITSNFNNEIKSLDYIPSTSGRVQLLDFTDTEGKRVYVRGIMYI
ncbi:MAG: hypothetical protein K2H53_01440, partial [Clostridia bacterium]|nr:hypothetical protein [Clostridia bacterium]